MTNGSNLNVLLVEDDDVDASLIQRLLRNDDQRSCFIVHATRLAEARAALERQSFDVILTDLCLPDSDGHDTVEELRSICKATPIIVLTDCDDEKLGLTTIRVGATDYLPKDQLSRIALARSIAYSIERFRFIGIEETNRVLESTNERLTDLYRMSQQFVDNVSHEFRTLLTVIREFAAIMRDEIDGPINSNQRSRLNSLINRTDDLSSMVDDLLDTSLLEGGLIRTSRMECDIADVLSQVERTVRARAKSKRIEIIIEETPPKLTAFCDEEKLRRVLVNLIVNAVKFTQQTGEVNVFAREHDDNQIEIVVADNGPGISQQDLETIFERFRQIGPNHRVASCKGFGLGLSIARALASLNLGELRVSSQEGVGSQFSVLVPRAAREAVLNCYLKQRISEKVGDGDISLTDVRMPANADKEMLEMANEFLRSNLNSCDLSLRTDQNRWQVLTCGSKSDVNDFYDRMKREWQEVRSDYLGPSLPDIEMFYCTTARVPAQREKLVEALAKPEPKKTDIEIEPSQPKLRRILVIEDELDLVSAFSARLNAAGYHIETAFDGRSGLKRAIVDPPEAVILDIRMPHLDGFSVLKSLRETPVTAAVPVIVVSGSINDKSLVLENGANLFIRKPYKPEAIVSAVEYVLGEKPVRQKSVALVS